VEDLVTMESPGSGRLRDGYRGARVLVTGHTGFKGAWLCEWLLGLGAEVHGLALAPDTTPDLFDRLALSSRLHHRLADVRDLPAVRAIVNEVRPDFVFHLAAQALVRRGYVEPVETFGSNVMGTVHILEALRNADHPCVAICVTTDKVYENRESQRAYHEADPLGGREPYGASKAAAEMVISAYRHSFGAGKLRVASARAGNVLGGGDWAEHRIVPDCIRALEAGEAIRVRHPGSTRPWQHVMEPLSGYLWLALRLREDPSLADAFNFGPNQEADRTVRALVEEILRHFPGSWVDASDPTAPHEASLLDLSIERALERLGWRPVWDFARTVAETVQWYRTATSADSQTETRRQIECYCSDAKTLGLPWAA
jgi:CDP-glucose 4,6-dehydratase